MPEYRLKDVVGYNNGGILQRTVRTIVRSMCRVKLIDKKWTMDLIQMLNFTEKIDQLARDNSIRCHGQVLRKDGNNFLRRALDFHVKWTSKRGRQKNTWIIAVVEESRKFIHNEGDISNRSRLV